MIKKNDFIELEFIGKELDGKVFDTNIPEEAKKIGMEMRDKPFVICVGQEMVVKGLDKSLEGKEINKKYETTLTPKEAFGERKRELVKLVPLNAFTEKNVTPKAGMTLALDNNLVRIASVSGGRVLVDFNNPLSGKEIIYEFKIKSKIDKLEEKINSLLDYFIRQRIPFTLEKGKAIFKLENPVFEPAIKIINDKFKDILKIELTVEKKETKETQ